MGTIEGETMILINGQPLPATNVSWEPRRAHVEQPDPVQFSASFDLKCGGPGWNKFLTMMFDDPPTKYWRRRREIWRQKTNRHFGARAARLIRQADRMVEAIVRDDGGEVSRFLIDPAHDVDIAVGRNAEEI